MQSNSSDVSPTQLSWIAESADGRRDEDTYIIKDATLGLRHVRAKELAAIPTAEIVATVPRGPETESTHRFSIGFIEDGGPNPLPPGTGTPQFQRVENLGDDPCDAFFFSASAVRKFLLPYYEAHRLLSEDDMRALRKADFSKIAGVAHYPPSNNREIGPDGKIIGQIAYLEEVPNQMVPTFRLLTAAQYLSL